jgi:DNA-binding SARP family transcriptional activator
MEFRILGPLEVVDEGRALPLGGSKQRALLALLLLEANRPVSRDRLIDVLWED